MCRISSFQAVLHLVPQQLHPGHLDNPGSGDLQVVQKHLAGDVHVVKGLLQGRYVLPGPVENFALQKDGGQVLGGDRAGNLDNAGHLGMVLGQGALCLPQKFQAGNDQAQLPLGDEVGGKGDELVQGILPIVAGGQVADGVQQGEGGVGGDFAGLFVIAQQGVQETGHIPGTGMGEHGAHHQLQGIADVAALLLGGLVVGKDNHVQVLRPQGERNLLRRIVLGVGGDLLAVDQVEAGDELADQGARLTADVTLPVNQQLIEEGERLGFLTHGEVGEIFLKHVEVGPQLLPALGGAGGLDDIAEFALVGQHVHQAQVVVYREQNQAVQRLLGTHKGGVLAGGRGSGAAGQVHIHPQAAHIVLKVVELAVNKLIPAALCPVHIVQLGQDDLEGGVQRVEDGDLISVGIPVLLGAEVGVDEQQGLHGQGLQLQVPDGVVGGDMADALHPAGKQPLVGVVVVKVRHPFPWPAAEFPHVVGGGGAGDEGQIHLHPRVPQPAGGRHGDIVDTGDVAQGAEGGYLHPKAHQLVKEFLPPGREKAAVLPRQIKGGVLLLREKLKIQQGVKREGGALVVQQNLKNGEVELGPAGIAVPVRGKAALWIHHPADILVAEGQPALLRLTGTYLGEEGAAGVQYAAAGEPLPDREQRRQTVQPGRVLQESVGGPPTGERELFSGSKRVGNFAVDLAQQLVVHRGTCLSGTRSAPGTKSVSYFWTVGKGLQERKGGKRKSRPGAARRACFGPSLNDMGV